MEISYNWLNTYLPHPLSIEDVSIILTQIGLEVEAITLAEAIPGSLKGLVVGEVLTCVPHPNADKLKLTTVHIGEETVLPIVCGAPNVAAGQKVIVATVGTTVHPTDGSPFDIKKAKIRGEVSEGMLCAEDEIGLGHSHDGIKILPNDTQVGTLVNSLYNIPASDYTISIGLTPNRSDANSHIGVARDICAYQTHHTRTQWNLQLPSAAIPVSSNTSLPFDVQVLDAEACPRYAGVTIQNIKVAPSPEWLQNKLKTIGQRSINNIVDITNYVLHEYGQPLHAFDYHKIHNHNIIVKKADEGSTFITLDEKERKLTGQELMICDDVQALCMAGIFGGQIAGVNESTTAIFLESAYFDPKTIRRASLHHGLRTDAATHFEKSVDISMVIPALKRAIDLIIAIAGGELSSDIIDIYPTPIHQKKIHITFNYINKLAGKIFEPAKIKKMLSALGFSIIDESADGLSVTVPSDKNDVSQAADLVEEIIRIDGLDNIEINNQLHIALTNRKSPVSRIWKEKIAIQLTALGFHEIVTNSITNSKYHPDNSNLVHMINSLTSELDVMRPSLLESGLEVLNYNINRKQQDLKLYEIGHIYHQEAEGKYLQASKLGIWLTGNVQGGHWEQKAIKANIFYIKGIVEQLLNMCGVLKYQVDIAANHITYRRGKDVIASIEQVSSEKLKHFEIKQSVYYAQLDMQQLVAATEKINVQYKELPKFPSMKRDLAIVVPQSISFQNIISILEKLKISALTNYDLFDIFESEKIGLENKSLALSFTFQLHEKTLTDIEADAIMQQIMDALEKDAHANIRK